MNEDLSFPHSQELYDAASAIIPGGVPRGGVKLLKSSNSPLYFEREKDHTSRQLIRASGSTLKIKANSAVITRRENIKLKA